VYAGVADDADPPPKMSVIAITGMSQENISLKRAVREFE
jgi:hypothetical protein